MALRDAGDVEVVADDVDGHGRQHVAIASGANVLSFALPSPTAPGKAQTGSMMNRRTFLASVLAAAVTPAQPPGIPIIDAHIQLLRADAAAGCAGSGLPDAPGSTPKAAFPDRYRALAGPSNTVLEQVRIARPGQRAIPVRERGRSVLEPGVGGPLTARPAAASGRKVDVRVDDRDPRWLRPPDGQQPRR